MVAQGDQESSAGDPDREVPSECSSLRRGSATRLFVVAQRVIGRIPDQPTKKPDALIRSGHASGWRRNSVSGDISASPRKSGSGALDHSRKVSAIQRPAASRQNGPGGARADMNSKDS